MNNQPKTIEQNKADYISEVAAQLALALESKDTPDAVKDCLKTIISEASTEADILKTSISFTAMF